MEKVLFVKENDFKELNKYLENGWTVKMISAVSSNNAVYDCYAYVVIEKE